MVFSNGSCGGFGFQVFVGHCGKRRVLLKTQSENLGFREKVIESNWSFHFT